MKQMKTDAFRVALMFKAKGLYGRNIIEGVCEHATSTRLNWELLLEDDFRSRQEDLLAWEGDGIIADLDDIALFDLVGKIRIPLVGIGGTYQLAHPDLARIPYVASDNEGLMRMAYTHLIEMGLTHFACYSIAATPRNRWAQERENAFRRMVQADGNQAHVFSGIPTSALDWSSILQDLCAWLTSLPKPVGIIAVTDARARQIMQACQALRLAVPEQIAVIGIDDDPTVRLLNRIPLSSIAQGSREMGRTAARLLQHRMAGAPEHRHIVVQPEGVNAQASSKHRSIHDEYVMRALYYIRQFAAQGIKAGSVADYVGVSRATLDAHFIRELGTTLHDELLHFKLALCEELLVQSPLSLAEIAQKSGFTTTQYMCTVFQREKGCTPFGYRQSRLEGQA